MAKRYDERFLKKWCERKSLEELTQAANVIEAAAKRGKALADLDQHPLVAKAHEAMEQAATETGTSIADIRLAEVRRYEPEMPAYELSIAKVSEQWKKDNATHRNPDNPEETWYSPDGRGNPPKWIQRLLGKKPTPKKDLDGYKEWMRKLDQFRIDRSEADMAA